MNDDQLLLEEAVIRARNRRVPVEMQPSFFDKVDPALTSVSTGTLNSPLEIGVKPSPDKAFSLKSLTPVSTGNTTTTTTTTTSSSQLVSTSELVYINPRPTTLYLPVEIVHRFKLRCLELRVTMSLVLSHLIADWLGGKLRVPELEKRGRANANNPPVYGVPNHKIRFK